MANLLQGTHHCLDTNSFFSAEFWRELIFVEMVSRHMKCQLRGKMVEAHIASLGEISGGKRIWT